MTLIAALRSRRHSRISAGLGGIEALAQATERVRQAFQGYSLSGPVTLGQSIQRLEDAVKGWEWSGVKLGDVALVAGTVLREDLRISPDLRSFLEREVTATSSPALLKVVCESFVTGWEPGSGRTRWLAAVIQQRKEFIPKNWRRTFEALPESLDTDQGHRMLAVRMVDQADPYQWLRTCGVVSPHAGGLMAHLHAAWLNVLPEPRTPEAVDQLFNWVRPDGQKNASNDWVGSVLEKLLSPWLITQPHAEFRQELLTRITDAYGDPRKDSEQVWSRVSERSKKLVIKWLAGKSMDALLSIVTSSTANHMWPPRHDFWKGLYDRGLIEDAWIALSPAASKDAEYMFQTTHDAIYTMAGRQTSAKRRETCLLIMKVGKYIVIEGSHDYRVHLFPFNERSNSLLYRDQYDAEALTLPLGDPATRVHDQYGAWMRWVEERVLR